MANRTSVTLKYLTAKIRIYDLESIQLMMKIICFFVLPFFLSTSAPAASSGFEIYLKQLKDDVTGQKIFQEKQGMRALIFIGYLDGCPILRKYQPTLGELKKKFGKNVAWAYYDPSSPGIPTVKPKGPVLFPVVHDDSDILKNHLNIRVASEVSVVDLQSYEVIYRGAIDDRMTLDFVRPIPTKKYLYDLLTRVTSGKEIKPTTTKAFGCALNSTESVE